MSQILIVLSLLAEARVLPSGVKATERTQSWCPSRVAASCRVARSQSLTVLSALAEARIFPSGEKANDQMPPACPLSEARRLPVATSQRKISPGFRSALKYAAPEAR